MAEDTTLLTRSRQWVSEASQDACLVHIYPSGAALGSRYSLGPSPVVLGRDPQCQIRLNDDWVSRQHACIGPSPEGYSVVDLRSTNGTFVNDARVSRSLLKDGDYLHVGNTIYRFLAGGNVEAEYHEEIYRLTIIDALTDVHNKRYLLEFLSRELARSTRYRRPLALVMCDIDKFKAINDELGHLGGDFTLRKLAGLFKNGISREQLVARYGGDEFALVMPETCLGEAVAVSQRLCEGVAENPLSFDGRLYQVTISMGVAAITGEDWVTSVDLLQQADDKLYQAKRQGRNRVAG